MRRTILTLFALLALGILSPIGAQSRLTVAQGGVAVAPATPDAVVARLMSFDRNHDGVVTVSELPERMQTVMVRNRAGATADALNATTIRNMALHPAVQPAAVRGVQAGTYGFPDDTEFDTRLHLDGAIDDLRLAKATHDKARAIGTAFMDRHDAAAKDEFLKEVTPLLTEAQVVAVKTVLDETAPAPKGVMVVTPNGFEPGAAFKIVPPHGQPVRVVRQSAIASLMAHMDIAAEQRRPINAAVTRLDERRQFTKASRAALLEQMRTVLTDRERDDLRAALERRPIVKQGGTFTNVVFPAARLVPPRPAAPPQQFGIRDLVLR
jgi:hypothetical protein